MNANLSRLLRAVFVVAALLVPLFFASGYQLFQLTLVVAYALSVLGKNLVTGFGGQVSLGQGAFYAVGAYTAAILMEHFDVPYWATIPVAAVTTGMVGLALGLPALRLGGLYLALVTFSMAVSVPQLLKYKLFEDWTGGVQGIVLLKPDAPFGLDLNPDQWLYLFSFVVGAALFLAANNLVRSRIGLAMRAIRDQPLAAEAMGVELARYKTLTFGVGALFAGVGGALGAIAVGFVSPDSFTIALSLTLFVGMVIGGASSISGAIYGAVFIVFMPNLAEEISKAVPGAIFGAILILFMFFAPGGIASLLEAQLRRLRAAR
ncbi:MAG: branched-chain amino acid ABC transporter permease [Acetobacteraceae bacterium]|nr:branched-chain amino acid ABC transporter permease [Acetobacteraceae bacterium]